MLDQRIINGIGNIYASEALYSAKISPFRESSSLKEDEIKKVKVKTFLNDFYNYSEVYFDGKLIHREKVNVLEYSKRNNKIKEFLIFSR